MHLGAQSTWDEVASSGMLGISRRQIFHLLGLTTLPEAVKDDIRSSVLNEKHGRALRTLRDNPVLLERAHNEIRQQKLSGDEALVLVRQMKKDSPMAARRVLKIYYQTKEELVSALEEKLQNLRAQAQVE